MHNHEEDSKKWEKIKSFNLFKKRSVKTKEKVEDIIINITKDVNVDTFALTSNISTMKHNVRRAKTICSIFYLKRHLIFLLN